MKRHYSIPPGWSSYKLRNIGEFKNGINKDSQDFGHGTPFVNLMDVFGNNELKTKKLGLVNANEKEVKSYNLLRGDILFIRSSVKPEGVGLTAVVTSLPPSTVYSGFLIRFRPLSNLLIHEYSKHCFLETNFRKMLLCSSSISANTNINQESLANLELLLPPLNEQREIARVIEILDRPITLMESLIAAKQQRRMWLIQELLTGKRRIPGFNDAWSTVMVGEIAEEVSKRNNGQFGAEVVRAVNKAEGMIPMKNQVMADDLSRYKVVEKTWFAYNPMRINIGSICQLLEEEKALVSPDYVVFKCREHLIDHRYFNLFRQSHRWQSFMEAAGNGSVRVRIYFSDLSRLTVPLPSLEEQRRIAECIEIAGRELHLLRSQLDNMRRRKNGLMQNLLTGKIRLKT